MTRKTAFEAKKLILFAGLFAFSLFILNKKKNFLVKPLLRIIHVLNKGVTRKTIPLLRPHFWSSLTRKNNS
jgi:hypothetical protein